MADDLPILTFENQQSLEEWLAREGETSAGIWLKIAKKGTASRSVSYAEAVDCGLCYGWIDSQGKSLDDQHYLQRFTPRRSKSKWSKINCQRAEALAAEGRIQPAGLRQIEAAKADGRWEAAYDPPSTISVPEDFQSELDNNQPAREFFDALDRTNRYTILHRIQIARKPETRQSTIQKFIEMLARGEKIY